MKIILGFCLECQKRKVLVFRLPTRRYGAYCETCLQQAFANYKQTKGGQS